MRCVRKIQDKTETDRIRNYTMRIGLGIIPPEEKKELVNFRVFVGLLLWEFFKFAL
jgi:hypothetical protein